MCAHQLRPPLGRGERDTTVGGPLVTFPYEGRRPKPGNRMPKGHRTVGLYYTAEGGLGPKTDKRIIEVFLKEAFSKLHKREFSIKEWPDVKDRQNKSVDALATTTDGVTVAIEHTLIEAFAGDLEDRVRFSKVFVPLQDDPTLRLANEIVDVVVHMGAVQKGTDWDAVHERTLTHLDVLH